MVGVEGVQGSEKLFPGCLLRYSLLKTFLSFFIFQKSKAELHLSVWELMDKV